MGPRVSRAHASSSPSPRRRPLASAPVPTLTAAVVFSSTQKLANQSTLQREREREAGGAAAVPLVSGGRQAAADLVCPGSSVCGRGPPLFGRRRRMGSSTSAFVIRWINFFTMVSRLPLLACCSVAFGSLPLLRLLC